MMKMKLILLATLASLALGAIPLSRQSPEEMEYSEKMDRQYPGFPPRSQAYACSWCDHFCSASRQNPNEPGFPPLSRQNPELDYSEEMDRQYPGFPPRSRDTYCSQCGRICSASRQNPNGPGFPPLSRQNPELDYSEEMDRAIGILTTGNFTLFGVDDAEVEKQKEEEEQEGEADRRYRGSRGYLRM